MNPDAKKVTAVVKVEGHEETWKVQFDAAYLSDGRLAAILEWGDDLDPAKARNVVLTKEYLQPSKASGILFDYEKPYDLVIIPKDLEKSPAPLSAEAIRRGFFRIG